MKRISLDVINSTNEYAKTLSDREGKELTLVTAEYQEAGRGAGTNLWESEHGKNLLFSIIAFPLHLPANQVFTLSEVTALSICDVLNSYTKGFQIKWPNDIYFGDKKVVGMLIENDLQGKFVRRSIIGVGININQTVFCSDAPNPASLAQIIGREEERSQVLDKIMQQFTHYYGIMNNEPLLELHDLYMQHLYRKDTFHTYADENGTFQARISDVEPSGHLVLECENQELRRYAFKEVSFIIEH
ncbi:MAG: biotin--[acetyl-CoA-carboxylase] ligase [Bacteroidaceae bacterium]|nr:biotin--[acetyl-CoA-carboxylase] ligase [Bacteroidaceae bacterium]